MTPAERAATLFAIEKTPTGATRVSVPGLSVAQFSQVGIARRFVATLCAPLASAIAAAVAEERAAGDARVLAERERAAGVCDAHAIDRRAEMARRLADALVDGDQTAADESAQAMAEKNAAEHLAAEIRAGGAA